MYEYTPTDWINWNPAQIKYGDYIPKPDPITAPNKKLDLIELCYQLIWWRESIPEIVISAARESSPTQTHRAEILDKKAKSISNPELKSIVLKESTELWSESIGSEYPIF